MSKVPLGTSRHKYRINYSITGEMCQNLYYNIIGIVSKKDAQTKFKIVYRINKKSGCREVKPVTLLTINEKDNILLHV